MPTFLVTGLARYGYLAIFLGVFLESAGVPVPGETVLLGAGFFASEGAFSLPWVIGLGVAAAILGDNLGYWVGRRGGRPLVERRGRLVGLTLSRLDTFDAFFYRHSAKTVFLARFVTGLRVVAAPFAGISRLPWPEFLFYNAAGALCWATTVALVGYFFGQSWKGLHHWLGRASLFGVALVLTFLVVTLVRRFGPALLTSVEASLPAVLTMRELGFVGTTLAALGLFGKIAEDVVTRESTGFDRAVSFALHRMANPRLDRAMRIVSVLGAAPIVLAVVFIVLAWRLRRKDYRGAGIFAAVALLTEGLNALLKLAFHRVRPSLWAVATPHSYSFPSGHAMAAVAIYGMVAVILTRSWPRIWGFAVLAALVLTLVIGISRVYLGHHWPTDVLAGYAAGAMILAGGMYALGRADASRLTGET